MWSELIPKEKLIIYKKNFLKILFLIYIFLIQNVYSIENEIYKKIDLFGEVLEKINKEYDEITNQRVWTQL